MFCQYRQSWYYIIYHHCVLIFRAINLSDIKYIDGMVQFSPINCFSVYFVTMWPKIFHQYSQLLAICFLPVY